MTINKYLVNSLILGFTFIKISCACDLVPSNDESCFGLTATPYITFDISEFGPNIEGASVTSDGEVFAVNYGSTTYQLGQVFPQQRLFYSDVNTSSFFNGIRFLNSATALAADVENHRVLQITFDSGNHHITNSSNYCGDVRMLQPNDLTLSKTGTVFTSGMNWVADTVDTDGDIWSCLPDGSAKRLELLGRTNGIELDPDEQHLYVSESHNRNGVPISQKIWRYDTNIDDDGTISGKTLFADFNLIDDTTSVDIDGMKTDISGNLFVTRHTGSHVAIFSAQGALIGKILLNFPNPTNLEFGGTNGKTLFIVGQCAQEGKGCVDRIEVNTPGRSWSMLQPSNAWRTFKIRNNLQIILFILLLVLFKVRS